MPSRENMRREIPKKHCQFSFESVGWIVKIIVLINLFFIQL